MIVARVSPARSWAGSCLRPGSRTVARPVRAVSGQRNASHGPCTLDVDDRGRQFAVGKWLLLLLAGTPVVRPALLWQWQWHGMLRDDAWRGLRRPDFDRCGSADLCRPAGNDSERPGAHHGAAIVSAAPAHAPAGANHALSADEENRQLIEDGRSKIEHRVRNVEACFSAFRIRIQPPVFWSSILSQSSSSILKHRSSILILDPQFSVLPLRRVSFPKSEPNSIQ